MKKRMMIAKINKIKNKNTLEQKKFPSKGKKYYLLLKYI